jgi:hypothetical protein
VVKAGEPSCFWDQHKAGEAPLGGFFSENRDLGEQRVVSGSEEVGEQFKDLGRFLVRADGLCTVDLVHEGSKLWQGRYKEVGRGFIWRLVGVIWVIGELSLAVVVDGICMVLGDSGGGAVAFVVIVGEEGGVTFAWLEGVGVLVERGEGLGLVRFKKCKGFVGGLQVMLGHAVVERGEGGKGVMVFIGLDHLMESGLLLGKKGIGRGDGVVDLFGSLVKAVGVWLFGFGTVGPCVEGAEEEWVAEGAAKVAKGG